MIKHLNCGISKNNYCPNIYFETFNFFGLLKIHKSKTIKHVVMTQDSEVISGMELSDLKIICIVGNPKCTTRKLSYVMDLLLKPFIKEVKSYTKGSTHIFSKFQQEVCDNKRNITFDLAIFIKGFHTS